MEGEEAKFHCVAKDRDTNVTWYKDGQPRMELSDLKSRSSVSDEGTLTIKETTMSDLGEYECEAINPAGERQTGRAYLNVQYKAKVVYAPKEVYFSFGQPAILDCHFRSNPPLTNLRWEKDGFLFDPYNVPGVFYKRNGSLYFTKVDEGHSGQYSCTPYNDLGTNGPSPPTKVIVQRPPVFVVTPNNLYLRKLGESIEIPCDARDGDGGHKPTIVWYKKDGSPLPEGRYAIKDGNLTIVNIHDDDRGHYQCSASNQAATVTTETELMVENVSPRAPYNLTGNSSQNAVTIRWSIGYTRPQLEYSIWYRPIDTAEWRTLKIFSRQKSEATVSNLNPGREYEFMILSQDKHGDGMFSKTIRIKTKGSGYYDTPVKIQSGYEDTGPMGPPRNVSVHLTIDGYVVSWEPPDHGRNLLRTYLVKWSEWPKEENSGEAETLDTYFNVKNLEEDNTYYFQVIAISHDNFEVHSEKIILMVPAMKHIRAISISIMSAVAILGIAFGIFYYSKKKCCRSYADRKNCNEK